MKLSYVFIYQAVVSLLFGIVALAVPETLGSTYGASLDKTAQTLAQYFGAAYITIGLVSWFLGNAPPSTERLAVVRSARARRAPIARAGHVGDHEQSRERAWLAQRGVGDHLRARVRLLRLHEDGHVGGDGDPVEERLPRQRQLVLSQAADARAVGRGAAPRGMALGHG